MSDGKSKSAATMLTSSARVELVPAESLGYSRWPMLGGRARLWDSRGVVECLKGGGDGCKALNEEFP